MGSEIKNKQFIIFLLQVVFGLFAIVCIVVLFNYFIDASQVIHDELYPEMAKLALEGNTVATPENYDERRYQIAVIENERELPDAIVIGSSRGMYIGEDITGIHNIYNHCVSGGILADDYAILGLYEQRFGELPPCVIVETSPWCFNLHVPESRWTENAEYMRAAEGMYEIINETKMQHLFDADDEKTENPYFSLSYFQYNLKAIWKYGINSEFREARLSLSSDEGADLPDGTIRYKANKENANPERLAEVQSLKGQLTYQGMDSMTKLDEECKRDYESLLRYLMNQGTHVIIYLSPFSVTQCTYIYDDDLNPIIPEVEDYLRKLGERNDIDIIGGYDARAFGLTDESFIDFMHLDRVGNKIVWDMGEMKSIGDASH